MHDDLKSSSMDANPNPVDSSAKQSDTRVAKLLSDPATICLSISNSESTGPPRRTTVLDVSPEVLADIFVFCIHLFGDHHYNSIFEASPLVAWATITAVCRYWREVALTTPLLWANIPVHHPSLEVIKLFFARLGDVPLTVLQWPLAKTVTGFKVMPLCLQAFERIRTLETTIIPEMLAHFERNSPISASLLSTLHMHLSESKDEVFYFMRHLEAPMLRDLTFSDDFPPSDDLLVWSNDLFPSSLERLCIQEGTFEEAHPSVVLRAVSHLRHLRVLELHSIFGDNRSFPGSDSTFEGTYVALPQLRELHISSTAMAICTLFLGCITIPASASIVLSSFPSDLHSDHQALFGRLRQHLAPHVTVGSLVLGRQSLELFANEAPSSADTQVSPHQHLFHPTVDQYHTKP
ncbi:hypothetical protein BXZ70DRAFT_637221 [Cristinia sonorae]|uniref:F-box domain-containing protein n=1 Tax=Cristinia sonorae TaxID=1940300 RepID=A0A8K0UF72_9AGAR|nr:hypothetical protein BXZ70DRAFT_637221 [Cristinia sonorae]